VSVSGISWAMYKSAPHQHPTKYLLISEKHACMPSLSLVVLQSLLFHCSIVHLSQNTRNATSDRLSFAIRTLPTLILRCLAMLHVLFLFPMCLLVNKSATCSICLLSLLIVVVHCQVFTQWMNLTDQHVDICSLQTVSSTIYQEILKRFFVS